MLTCCLLLASYLVGSIPSGYLLVRAARGQDVRQYGSHNVGAINVFRVGGLLLGLATLAADAGKALAVVLVSEGLTHTPAVVAAAAFCVVLGHCYSAWLFLRERRFSEGKGVACALGILAGLAGIGVLPARLALIPPAVWAAGLMGPRLLTGRWQFISPATMAAALSLPFVIGAAHLELPYTLLAVAMAGLVLLRHRNNIRRLLAGTEPRAGERLKPLEEAPRQP